MGFRAYAHRVGLELGLLGWVRNLQDGRVEVLACGSAGELEEFASRLKQGSPRSLVIAVAIEDWTGEETLCGFDVRKDSDQPCGKK